MRAPATSWPTECRPSRWRAHPIGMSKSASAAPSTGCSTSTTATAPAGAWVVSVWSDKSSDAREFDAPADLSERSNLAGIGTGDVATLVADSGAGLPAGQVGGLTATVVMPPAILPELPQTAVGKINKRELRDRYARG